MNEVKTSISVIMPCYNQGYHLKRVLEAYEQQTTTAPFEIIAINDASSDNTPQILNSFAPQRYTLRVFHQEKNQGPAAARNLGIRAAQNELVIFVGDDILPEKNFLDEHLAAHRRHPDPAIAILGRVSWPDDMPVNSLMKHIDGMGAEQFSYFYFKEHQEYDFRHFYTANISIRRAVLMQEDHFFDSDFRYAAYEDVELSYRLSKKGMKIIYDPGPVGHHYHYHTIWSFSERQYRAGLMAHVIGSKHPALRAIVMGKNWLPHMATIWLQALLRPASAKEAAELENMVIQLVSSFEWSPDPVTDWLYIRVLQYFYYKGIVRGFFGERVVNSYAYATLAELLEWFSAECQARQLPSLAAFKLILV